MQKKSLQTSKNSRSNSGRVKRARKMVAYLKRTYPKPESELRYGTPFQFVVAVMMSAQCTDKVVNRVTENLFKKYKTASDFASANPKVFEKEISSVTFYRNKAKAIRAAAKEVVRTHNGKVPKTARELEALSGIGYKTAHVILGQLYEDWPGIPTDTHVKRFAWRFDLSRNTDLKKISKDLEALVPKKDWKYVNNGLVLYGRYVCKAHRHDCTIHPLTHIYPKSNDIWPRSKS